MFYEWGIPRSNGIYPAFRSSARCAARSTSGASSRPGRFTAPGRTARTRTTGSLLPHPGRWSRQADSAQGELHLLFHDITAEDVAAILARVNREGRECVC